MLDVCTLRIVDWRASTAMRTDLALDGLEQPLGARPRLEKLVHRSDRGAQHPSSHYTEQLAEASHEPSVGRFGDSYDNALMESTIGLFKAEVIRQRDSWRNLKGAELAALERVSWHKGTRLLGVISHVPPAEFEESYHRSQPSLAAVAGRN